MMYCLAAIYEHHQPTSNLPTTSRHGLSQYVPLTMLLRCIKLCTVVYVKIFSVLLLQVHRSGVHYLQTRGGEVHREDCVAGGVQGTIEHGGRILPGEYYDTVCFQGGMPATHCLYQCMSFYLFSCVFFGVWCNLSSVEGCVSDPRGGS